MHLTESRLRKLVDVLIKFADDEDSNVRSGAHERLKSKNKVSENLIRLIRALIIN